MHLYLDCGKTLSKEMKTSSGIEPVTFDPVGKAEVTGHKATHWKQGQLTSQGKDELTKTVSVASYKFQLL